MCKFIHLFIFSAANIHSIIYSPVKPFIYLFPSLLAFIHFVMSYRTQEWMENGVWPIPGHRLRFSTRSRIHSCDEKDPNCPQNTRNKQILHFVRRCLFLFLQYRTKPTRDSVLVDLQNEYHYIVYQRDCDASGGPPVMTAPKDGRGRFGVRTFAWLLRWCNEKVSISFGIQNQCTWKNETPRRISSGIAWCFDVACVLHRLLQIKQSPKRCRTKFYN